MPKTLIEPFRIKSVEPIRFTTESERRELSKRLHDGVAQGVVDQRLLGLVEPLRDAVEQ
mgnify:CR=1 FL=1